MPFKMIRQFIRLETSAGILLVIMATLALIISNSPLRQYYDLFLSTHVAVKIGKAGLDKPLIMWINDGFMAIFFLLVGLEIKREMLVGELNSWHKISLPLYAAIGGMLVPALFYIFLNYQDPTAIRGWAIPTATDIAFALGILSLLGSRIPISLKIFLTALAILDDIGAIIVIAAFYTAQLSLLAVILALTCIVILLILNWLRVMNLTPYLLTGLLLWIFVLKSGVHATLAGVIVAFFIPMHHHLYKDFSPLRYLEHALHPWVAYGILPLFAFANAGVSFAGLTLKELTSGIPLGIATGLFFGKQIGVFGAVWLGVKTRLCRLPTHATWSHIYGIALLCGVGFTMSLFIGTLAFNETKGEYATLVRLGVLSGSVISGLLGYSVLRLFSKKREQYET